MVYVLVYNVFQVLVDPMVTFRQQLNSRKQLKLREDNSKLKEDALRFLEMLIGCCSALPERRAKCSIWGWTNALLS